MDNYRLIHCIGDSHASFFSGYDEIQPCYPEKSRNKYSFLKSHRLGAVLAYSLHKLNTKESGREKLFELLKKIEKDSALLLCFGEIDCRCHLILHSKELNRNLQDVVLECVDKYFLVVDELMNLGFYVSIWGAIPSTESNNSEYPSYGSQVERNKCTNLFNQFCSNECEKRGINFISINNILMSRSLLTKLDYFFDCIHLGKIAIPFAFKKLKAINNFNQCITFSNYQITQKIVLAKMQYYRLVVFRILKISIKKFLKYKAPI